VTPKDSSVPSFFMVDVKVEPAKELVGMPVRAAKEGD
jgi:hypothetical protein